jgi:hypothetical protein
MPDSHKACSEAHNVQICGRCGLCRQAPDCVQIGGSGAEQTGTWVAERGGIALAATWPAR